MCERGQSHCTPAGFRTIEDNRSTLRCAFRYGSSGRGQPPHSLRADASGSASLLEQALSILTQVTGQNLDRHIAAQPIVVGQPQLALSSFPMLTDQHKLPQTLLRTQVFDPFRATLAIQPNATRPVPVEFAGKWGAWTLDHTRIVVNSAIHFLKSISLPIPWC